jgi:hypothetical protein
MMINCCGEVVDGVEQRILEYRVSVYVAKRNHKSQETHLAGRALIVFLVTPARVVRFLKKRL